MSWAISISTGFIVIVVDGTAEKKGGRWELALGLLDTPRTSVQSHAYTP